VILNVLALGEFSGAGLNMEDGRQKQIDILLRDHYRRGEAGASLSKDNAGQHLDADELNSYAEQSLPPAAREHYTQHLAGCKRCSTQLAALAPLAVEALRPEPLSVEPVASLTWMDRLRALFRTPSFRYALPAFVVLLTIAGVFVAVRNSRGPGEVARVYNRHEEQIAPDAPIPQSSNAPAVATGPTGSRNVANAPKDEPAQAKESKAVEESVGVVTAQKEDQAAVADKRIAELQKSKQAGAMADEVSKVERERAASPPAAAPSADSFRSLSATASPPQEAREDDAKMKTESSANSGVGGANKDEPARRPELGAARKASPGFARSQPSAEGQSRDETVVATKPEVAEVRTVGTRAFRRNGNRWIDVNYGGGTVINVKRGSEQFRALMSDEPDLKAILQRLSGDVLVVWRGRAYRFTN
jgi:hypothetical protein